jgi:hypothetical protein
MRFPQTVEPPISRSIVDRCGGDDLRAGLDRVIDRGADHPGGTVDVFERGRDLLEEEDRAGSGQRRVLRCDLLDLSRGFPDPLHRRLRAPAEGVPAMAGRERPLVRSGFRHR